MPLHLIVVSIFLKTCVKHHGDHGAPANCQKEGFDQYVSRRSCLRFVNILVLLPAFQALAGCDTTSAFVGKGKRTARSVWIKFKDVTLLYLHLPKHQRQNTQMRDSRPTIKRFVIVMQDLGKLCSHRKVGKQITFGQQRMPYVNTSFAQDIRLVTRGARFSLKHRNYQAGRIRLETGKCVFPVRSEVDACWGAVLCCRVVQKRKRLQRTMQVGKRRVSGIATSIKRNSSQYSLSFKRFHENVAFYTKQDFLTQSCMPHFWSCTISLYRRSNFMYAVRRV